MSYAENKPLIEYGDLSSEHHATRHERELEDQRKAALLEEPPQLHVVDGPGNLYKIEWTYGDMEIPFECHGHWNHAGRARDAINGAMARLRKQEAADVLAKAQADEQAKLTADVAAEKERLDLEAKINGGVAAEAAEAHTEKTGARPPRGRGPAKKSKTTAAAEK